jgi:hypothetical protein
VEKVVIMKHTEFRFVDLAVGGATKRNNVYALDELPIPKDATDTYTTMFRFREEYKEHVESSGSVRGADKFECWSDYLWFDIDAEGLQDATIDMQALLRGLRSMGVLDRTVVFFSGSKGYHVGIESDAFGFEPSQELPEQMRRTAIQIASVFNIDTLDAKVYNHNRLWRVVDTWHSKTKLRKTALKPEKAIELSIDEVKKAASSGRGRKGPRYIACGSSNPVESLVRLSREASTGAVKKSANWDAPPLSDRRAKLIEAGLLVLLEHGVHRGARDNEALLRASEARKIGYSQRECHETLATWNQLNDPPLADDDLERVVESAYTGSGYDFGTNHDSLRLAREKGEKQIEEIDVDKLLNDEHKTEDTPKYEKRPYTLAEILAGGYEPNEPEVVGEYISWRMRITLLVGREKYSGKSTLCTFEAMAALRKGHRIMWVSPDEPQEDIIYRLMRAGGKEYADQIVLCSDQNVPTSWKELGQYIADSRPDLIILDSIHSLFPILNETGKVPDSSESAEWQKLVARLRPLAIALDAAVVWIHHANKATNLSAGSIGITAAVDAIVNLGTVRKDNRRTLQYLGRRVNSKMNCALDYLGEEEGYERVTDWNANMQKENDELSKAERNRLWIADFIASCEGDTFTTADAEAAYRAHFNKDPKTGGAVKTALASARSAGLCKLGEHRQPGESQLYEILPAGRNNDTKPSDLIGDDDGEE